MSTSLIPESAPFTKEQRAWLNGFFSGMMGMQSNGDSAAAMQVAAAGGLNTLEPQQAIEAAEEEEDFPWHDDSLPIVDRMELAKERPMERQLMAAMAQLNCGSCGYLCQTYAEAIASGEESNLTLCSPGGKETAKMVKKLVKASGGASTGAAKSAEPSADSGYSRKRPYEATLLESRPLNGPGSAKDTRHVVIDLADSGIHYEVGDALGVYPSNCCDLAKQVIQCIEADPQSSVTVSDGVEVQLLDALCHHYCLKDPSDELLELMISDVRDSSVKGRLVAMLEDGVPEGYDVLDVLQEVQGMPVDVKSFLETLGPMNARLYSIASSQKQVGNQVCLTVGKVAYDREGRLRKGVASTMLAERLSPGDSIRVFTQPNHGGFTVPEKTDVPMIMVGPGTGIAPFLAFLQERKATAAPGDNWLFFGDQHESCDFLYKEELDSYTSDGTLNRLDTAFSRDGESKVYVQDRMRQQAEELYRWLERGAVFYVCGDAKRMAVDVDRALVEIIADQAGLSLEDAQAYVKQLSADKRYVRDVY